ncbi:PR domain zinc finger protein 8 [Astyanax mexicanus]|uniref:PR domain zinc finger protein 8 n=1 Tax=Astyanax mexicanus TaxID=7994 RepID=UPI0020CAF9AE|nr:PR domain zinc finger protein 8 [Astyanax mexicanus]XP_015461327.2 PR domain zinc finger protein 8 [Astyanax mexicanus]
MEHTLTPRSLWTNDSKFLHHHSTDLFTSVQVTQDIPPGATFGPCLLHNTFYDTIAFIALKSFDKREKSYVFRVDPEAMRSSPLMVPWLRLVQAAMNTAEQNTEAFLKSGQLYFRTTRHVTRGEELFVWYDEELSHLLGLSDIKPRAVAEGLSCGRCGQAFRNENPFLAHCRFLCAQVKPAVTRPDTEQKRQRRVTTDFHNIARDLEHVEQRKAEDALASRKRKHEESASPRSRKPVLLEKTNIDHNTTVTPSHSSADSSEKLLGISEPDFVLKSGKNSAFGEINEVLEHKREPPALFRDVRRELEPDTGLQSDSSAFSFVLPGSAHAQQKSAFCKPQKRAISSTEGLQHPGPPLCNPRDVLQQQDDHMDTFGSKTTVGYRNLLASHLFQGDHASAQTMAAAPLLYAPEQWSGGGVSGQLRPSASSLTLLPATFGSLQGVSVQNWCAKCNLSFRMTSDLVLHMRSHHKKEFAAESQARRRREEKLTCPICHEYFRERHHLSRHMTSHN